MDQIQPGNGYTFKASSSGFSLDIEKPWTPPQGDGIYAGVKLPPFPDINGPEIPDELFPDYEYTDLQFKVETIVVEDKQYVRISKGAVNYTVSNMPEVWKGATSDVRQAWIKSVAVRPDISMVNGGNSGSSWMEDGGYYILPNTGTYYVTISKIDVSGSVSTSPLVQTEVPFVSIFSADSDLYAKIFSETGPSQYLNTTNVQKMSGYDADSTGLDGDFGNCHTTWFLPVKWGYACKIIAVIEAVTPVITEPTIEVLRPASETNNEVHRITLPPDLKKMGGFQLQYQEGFFNSTQSDPFDPFDPLNSGNVSGQFQWNLSNALKAITDLRGNASVAVPAPNKLDITYINQYANTAVPLPSIINNSVGVPTTTYNVQQHVVGSIDLSIGLSYIGSTLMNKPDVTEADDPYNTYESTDWEEVSNHTLKTDIESIAPQNLAYFDIMIGPDDWTSANYSWIAPGGCIPEPSSDHPFKVVFVEEAEGSSTYRIVAGTVNNLVPVNILDTIAVTGVCQVWLKVPYDSATKTFPFSNAQFTWNIGPTMPDSDTTYSYVRIAEVNGSDVTQLVTGSLWGDRIQVGSGATQNAHYYYARV